MRKNFLHKKVMIVDDNDLDFTVSSAVIEKNSFAEDIVNFNAVDPALEYLKSLQLTDGTIPNVIFLDVNMPQKDGFDFLDGYLKFPKNIQKQSTIIMISATNSEEDLERIKSYPIVRMFFPKPLSPRILNEIDERLFSVHSS